MTIPKLKVFPYLLLQLKLYNGTQTIELRLAKKGLKAPASCSTLFFVSIMTQETVVNHGKPLIVITGASSGIGEACAKYFHKEGHPLLLLARRVDKMEKEFGKLKNVLIAKVDVTKYDEMHAALEKAEQIYGPCDCLINNAGIFLGGKIVGRTKKRRVGYNVASQCLVFSYLFFFVIFVVYFLTDRKIKVFGVLNGIKCVLKGMKERKHGTIINISSTAAKKHSNGTVVYCASKAAVSTISEGVRAEVADSGVKVTTICPGLVQTELLETNKEKNEIYNGFTGWMKSLPNGPLLPEDVADACLCLNPSLTKEVIKKVSACKKKIFFFFFNCSKKLLVNLYVLILVSCETFDKSEKLLTKKSERLSNQIAFQKITISKRIFENCAIYHLNIFVAFFLLSNISPLL
ncbi:putative oxidoreductase short-chain dehydrogenase/reductase family protein [Reticulomyxa filosa]|uniref:Putative oxidoreductase short-chain dehydrogenase/reductase family protein n=1 Tax=Reticulomyxa filosa TaxID=46433 RepID=X6NXZ7_RETFI|nr:putative oxidoreductase short-chain dehydrogenase/reductase family protein [Reticulomyxa filosa]|eukprot:ETO30157.1 putative oxidoreductase short-chain dehydrogenase/reductase family protein [Reticulomyxa filosa]